MSSKPSSKTLAHKLLDAHRVVAERDNAARAEESPVMLAPECSRWQDPDRVLAGVGRTVTIAGWGAVTDRGLQRAVNEDALLAEPPLFVVADGMGGHAAGDVASWLAVERMAELASRTDLGAQETLDALMAANLAIVRAATASAERADMGTTIAGLVSVLAGGVAHWLVFNVGDSRVYRLAGGLLTQLTVDHSEAEELVASGQLTREQARGYERRHVVTRSLGTDPPPTPDSWLFPPLPSERFLVCSDGLTTEVDDGAVTRCLLDTPEPQRAARELVRLALEGGGRDNVTVIVVDSLSSTDGVDADTAPRTTDAG